MTSASSIEPSLRRGKRSKNARPAEPVGNSRVLASSRRMVLQSIHKSWSRPARCRIRNDTHLAADGCSDRLVAPPCGPARLSGNKRCPGAAPQSQSYGSARLSAPNLARSASLRPICAARHGLAAIALRLAKRPVRVIACRQGLLSRLVGDGRGLPLCVAASLFGAVSAHDRRHQLVRKGNERACDPLPLQTDRPSTSDRDRDRAHGSCYGNSPGAQSAPARRPSVN